MLAHRRATLLIVGVLLLFAPLTTYAVGMAADAMCNPVILQCGCGQVPNPKGGCMGGSNMWMCPCFDLTSGFTTSGQCVAPNKCLAQKTSDSKGPDAGLAKLGEMLGKLMEQLMKGGGGGGGGGDTPIPNSQMCTTLQPTPDQTLSMTNPGCFYYQPPIDLGTTTAPIDPSGGLVATPTTGAAPLTVFFAFTNGNTACNTPTLVLDFGDGQTEQQQIHIGNGCSGISETTQHTYMTAGSYSARLLNASTQEVRGGVNLTVTEAGTETTDTTTSTGGTNTNTTDTTFTSGNATNIGSALFNTPLTNLNSSGSVTSGNSNPFGSTAGSASTGGTNGGTGAALNFNTPQSIVQSIIQKNLPPGAYGDVRILDNGTTIVAGLRDQTSEVAGFYGTNSASGQGQGAVAKLCTNRPWASNFLSYVIPPSFFDSLCTWRGYTVGTQQAAITTTTTGAQTTTVKPSTGTPPPKNTSTKPPATTTAPATAIVDIWASPATVPLGARTSIFWNTQGVTDCIETSPDGSFSHASLKGGASTVPLTAATTFTISCVAPNGAPVIDNVIVQIAL